MGVEEVPGTLLERREPCQGHSRFLSLGGRVVCAVWWDVSFGEEPGDGGGRRQKAFAQFEKKSPLTQPDMSVLAFPMLNYTRINLGLGEKPH